MTGNLVYLLVDWQELVSGFERTGSVDSPPQDSESGGDWFSHRKGLSSAPSICCLIQFSDWLAEISKILEPSILGPFWELMYEIGVVCDERGVFRPIQKLHDREDDLVFAAVPPSEARLLSKYFQDIDTVALCEQLVKGYALMPCTAFSSDKEMMVLVSELHRMVRTAADHDKGILVLKTPRNSAAQCELADDVSSLETWVSSVASMSG